MSSAIHGREVGELCAQKSVIEYKANHNPFKEKKKTTVYIYVLYIYKFFQILYRKKEYCNNKEGHQTVFC